MTSSPSLKSDQRPGVTTEESVSSTIKSIDSDGKECGSVCSTSSYVNPLHQLISSYDFDAVKNTFSSASNDVERFKMASTPDTNGDLPLHMCLKRNAPDDIILSLLEVYEDSVSVPAGLHTGSLPLHLAAIYCASSRVIVTLIRRYPEALDATDEDGDTPRNCVRRNIDPVARDALSKPTEYWTTLLAEVRTEAEDRARRNQMDLITELEDKLKKTEQELAMARLAEKVSTDKLRTLDRKCQMLEELSVSGSNACLTCNNQHTAAEKNETNDENSEE